MNVIRKYMDLVEMENYFDKKFPNESPNSRKIRIALTAFERILTDSPGIDIPKARDMAANIADIDFVLDSDIYTNFIERAAHIIADRNQGDWNET